MTALHHFTTSPLHHILITGAANGLGRATALEFARQGCLVIATDIDNQVLDGFEGINTIIPKLMDVTSDESVTSLFREVEHEYGSIDLIINNAGVDRYFPLSEAPVESFKEIFEINLFGAYRVNQTFLPIMKSPGGRIILIGSESYHLTLPFMPYPLTKRTLESYAKALRQELKFSEIDVVIVRPGPIKTNFIKNLSNIIVTASPPSPRGKKQRHPVSDLPLAAAFKKFAASVPGEVGKVVPPEKVASFIYRVSGIRHPASVYRINNSLQLRLAALLPFRILEKVINSRLT